MTRTEDSSKIRNSIERLLTPRSVALIGASSTPGSLGASVLLNLENAGFTGDLYLVNPKRAVIWGRTCLGSVDELPEAVDCVVLAIPGHAVVETARACARRKIASLIVFSAGFAEAGEAGKIAQNELIAIAKEHGMILEGPNCLGMVNYGQGIPLTFVVTPPQAATDAKGVAIISQSGALAAVLAVSMRHHGMSLTYSISTGNEAVLGVEDFLDHLIDDRHTRIFALVVEQLRSPRRFLELARRTREMGKYLVLLHMGSSRRAQASAATHTGAMAGNYEVMRTLVTHAGVALVESMEEFVDVSQILLVCRRLPVGGAAVITESGAFKALALDLCERIGLTLPELSGTTYAQVRKALPPFIAVGNPLDITAHALVDPGLYRRTLPPILADENFGSLMLGIILTDPSTTALKMPAILDAIRTLKPDKPMVFASLDEGPACDPADIRELQQLGVACFPSAERALRALARVTALAAQDRNEAVADATTKPMVPIGTGVHTEYRSKGILASLGVSVPEGAMARSLDEALEIGCRIGFPVALKAQAAALPHKSDAGAVLRGVGSPDELIQGWSRLAHNLAAHKRGMQLDGVLVERMAEKGIELILGVRNDPDWGPVLLIGFGGVQAEALHDTRLLAPDLPMNAIVEEFNKLKCAALLRGFRGTPPLDVFAVAGIVATLGQLIRSEPRIVEIDLNPVVVYPKGRGALALDALIVASVE